MKTALATFTGIFQTKDEACALLRSSCTSLSDWTFDDYSPAGQWFLQNQQNNASIYDKAAAAPTAAVDTPTTLYASDDYWSFSNGCNVSVSLTDTWADTSMQYASYDVTVSNTSSSDVTNWRFRITWNEEFHQRNTGHVKSAALEIIVFSFQ